MVIGFYMVYCGRAFDKGFVMGRIQTSFWFTMDRVICVLYCVIVSGF